MVISSTTTSSSSAAANRAPAIPSTQSSKIEFKGVGDINKFFNDPETLNIGLRELLTSQFENQFTNNSRILHELPAKITFTVNDKKYNVFFFKNKDEMEKWKKGEEMVFQTADGAITMNKTPSQKESSQEGEEIGLVSESLVTEKLYKYICEENKISVENQFNGFNKKTADEFIIKLKAHKASNNRIMQDSQISASGTDNN